MAASQSPLQNGAKVKVYLPYGQVSVKRGIDNEIWALSKSGPISISPAGNNVTVQVTDGVISAPARGIAAGGNIGNVSTGNGQMSGTPAQCPDHAYTLYVPSGTAVSYMKKRTLLSDVEIAVYTVR